MNYPNVRSSAKESARVVGNYIGNAVIDRKYPIQLSIVAHSMGCRVALELVQFLEARKVKLELLVLMAAAVPRYMCERGEDYDLARCPATRILLYHSYNDEALGPVFRLGQFFETTNPASWMIKRGAIGREGLSKEVLSDNRNIEQRKSRTSMATIGTTRKFPGVLRRFWTEPSGDWPCAR